MDDTETKKCAEDGDNTQKEGKDGECNEQNALNGKIEDDKLSTKDKSSDDDVKDTNTSAEVDKKNEESEDREGNKTAKENGDPVRDFEVNSKDEAPHYHMTELTKTIEKSGETTQDVSGDKEECLLISDLKDSKDEEETHISCAKEESIPLKTKEVDEQYARKKGGLPARWIMAVLGCIGFMIVYGLKVNLSVAIIAMVNHTAVAAETAHHDDAVEDGHHYENSSSSSVVDCGVDEKKEALLDGPFAWDENIQGIVLASYFYGYIFLQVPGGWIAEKFSAKHVFGIGALANAILTVLTPVAASASYIWLIVIRVGMGIAGGVTLPGMHVLIASWAPPQERSKIASTVYAGMTLGTLLCMPFSGLLAASLDWTAVFYVQGGLSFLWYILWMIFVFDSPSKHPRISVAERKFIEESIGTVSKAEKQPIPWKSLWTSLPVWAIIVAHTCSNWGWYMLLVKLPTYMRYILKFDIKANAGISAIPFLCNWIFTMILANVLDALRSRKIITTSTARKFATFIASIPPAVCLIAVTYVGCNTDLAVVLLTLGTMFVGGMYCGFLSNHIDIAPPFAGTLMGISNTFATLPGIVVPSFVGYMTHGNQTVEAWRTIFFITLGVFGLEAVFFTIFGSGEEQPWVKSKNRTDPEEQKLNDGL